MVASPDGSKLYVGVGSNSNITENGIDVEEGRAAIYEVDRATGAKRIYATGTRNPTNLAIQPGTGQLFAVVNERDEIGPDLVPDYLTSIREGGFYGWPYSYWGQHVDVRVHPQRPDMVAKAIKPDYGLSSHVATLGVTFSQGETLSPRFANGAFVGEHGSWDRDPAQRLSGDLRPLREWQARMAIRSRSSPVSSPPTTRRSAAGRSASLSTALAR